MKILKLILILFVVCSCGSDKISEKSIDLNNKAVNAISNEKYDDALKLADEAINEDVNNYNAYTVKAQILIKQNKLNEATKVVEKLLEIKPDFAEGWTYMGLINNLNRNQKQANIDYKKGIELFQKRNQNNEFTPENNDTNIYYSLFLIGDSLSIQKMAELENKWRSNKSTYETMIAIKNMDKDEMIKQLLTK